MPNCPKCGKEVSDDQRFCPSCGTEATTERTVTSPARSKPAAGPATSTDPTFSRHGRFDPGTMIGTRFRIVGLLGRGGMGEVYRADDLELGQSVALKFLPERVAADPAAVERFRNEVRTARQVSHPNVCRMYDIGEADGLFFLSMEYIDGEDLAHVLKRMGRPSNEKALEITRQLCLGLAAAHENGVLHRDLKPANVMIDGRGRVRITDFGLAGLIDQFVEKDERAGTPAYMAPEQLASGTVSVRSDVYALGLVLYEIFTGKKVYESNDASAIAELHSSGSITSPSTRSGEIDPVIERVIMRCLEKDPRQRPSSVYAVLGALPGGDPLAAALAAGETPSPELLAESGESGGLAPPYAIGALACGMLLMLLALWLNTGKAIPDYIPMTKTDAELAVRAEDTLRDFGYKEIPRYTDYGFSTNRDHLEHFGESDASAERWSGLKDVRPSPLRFWYRASDQSLMGRGLHVTAASLNNPPLAGANSAIVVLDMEGRLLHLATIPSEIPSPAVQDWEDGFDAILERSGLDLDGFKEVPLVKNPGVLCDTTKALKGKLGASGEVTIQLGSFNGTPNYFEIIGPWNLPEDEFSSPVQRPPVVVAFVITAVLCATLLLAYRNLKLGRGDRKGAFRMALTIIVGMTFAWAIAYGHLSASLFDLIGNLFWDKPIGHALQHAAVFWVLYIALEPYARKYWPKTLVSWTRLLMGRFRDPQIGRDILIGGVLAGAIQLIDWVAEAIGSSLGVAPAMPDAVSGRFGLTDQLAHVVGATVNSINVPLFALVLLVILRVVLRRNWVAILGVIVVAGAISVASGWDDWDTQPTKFALSLISGLLVVMMMLTALLRIGIVALAVASMSSIIKFGSTTLDFSRWYADTAAIPVVVYFGVLAFGCYTALAGRPIFKDELVDA